MQKLLLITALTVCSSTLLVASATADIDFQNKVQKLESVVKTPWWNPITSTLNTTYRLPTKAAYQERLALAKQVHETTGKSQLLRKVCDIGYQSSWLKKRPSLNLICYSPATAIAAVALFFPEKVRGVINGATSHPIIAYFIPELTAIIALVVAPAMDCPFKNH